MALVSFCIDFTLFCPAIIIVGKCIVKRTPDEIEMLHLNSLLHQCFANFFGDS
jgi:hypothetical protein